MAAEYYKDSSTLGDVRCEECQKLLAKRTLVGAGLEMKCPRCGTLNRIFDGAGDIVLVTDADGDILYANQQVLHATGYTTEEVVGKTPQVWSADNSPEFFRDVWSRIRESRVGAEVVVNNKRKDGTLYRASLRVSPVLDAAGQVKLFIATQSVLP